VKIYNLLALSSIINCCVVFGALAAVEIIKDSKNVDATPSNIGSYRAILTKARLSSPTKGVYKLEKITGVSESDCDTQGMRLYTGTITSTIDYNGCYKFEF